MTMEPSWHFASHTLSTRLSASASCQAESMPLEWGHGPREGQQHGTAPRSALGDISAAAGDVPSSPAPSGTHGLAPRSLPPALLTLASAAPVSSTGSARACPREGASTSLGLSRGSAPSTWGSTPKQTLLEMAEPAGADPTGPSLPDHRLTCYPCGHSQLNVQVGKGQPPPQEEPSSKQGQVAQGCVPLSLSHLQGWRFPHLSGCPSHHSHGKDFSHLWLEFPPSQLFT